MKNNLTLFATLSLLIGLYACCPENCNCDTSQNTLIADTDTLISSTDIAIDTARVDTTGEVMTLKATIKNYEVGNADAKETRIIITLPVETKIHSFQAITDKGITLNWKQCRGLIYVNPVHLTRCTKDTVAFANHVKITLVTAKPDMGFRQFGIYAYDKIQDGDVSNNYWFWANNTQKTNCPKCNI